MQTLDKKSTKKAWADAIVAPAKEFSLTQLPVISGKIPTGLRGTLYRNGAARLERGGVRVGHWFDGDGAILAVNFTDAGASAVYRYIQTTGYQAETAAGKFLYGNYGMKAPGAFWNQWLRPVKHAANTSVLALPNKLLALWEGNHPYALDLNTLETQGLDNLGGLAQGLPYSAHPKVDPDTGEIFNFGVTPSPNAVLNLYKSDYTGKILQKAQFTLEGFPVIHDFVLAGQYLIFFLPPVRINVFPVLFGFGTYCDSMQWRAQLGTEILVFDRETLTLVSRGQTEPWYQWHFANGYVDTSGTVIIDFARYQDFQTNQYLKEVATGKTHTLAKTTLTRVQLQPQTGKVIGMEILLDRTCEFPLVPKANVGKAARYTYMSIFRSGTDVSQEILNAIARLDHKTQTLTEAHPGENCYPCEPILAQDWLLTVVYDGNHHRSEVWVYNSDRLDQEPVCKLELPSVIPHSFHGTWHSA